MITLSQVLNLYKRLGGLGRTIKPTLNPGDVLIFNKCLVHRLRLKLTFICMMLVFLMIQMKMAMLTMLMITKRMVLNAIRAAKSQGLQTFQSSKRTLCMLHLKDTACYHSYFQLLWCEYFGQEEVGMAGFLLLFLPHYLPHFSPQLLPHYYHCLHLAWHVSYC